MTKEHLRLDCSKISGFIGEGEVESLYPQAEEAYKALRAGTCPGNDFLGWLDLPLQITEKDLDEIEETAAALRARTQVLVVIGIGGSYLGARAVIEALSNSFHAYDPAAMQVIFAGHNISEDYYHELEEFLADKEFGICVISKSGTTTEPAIAFRLLRELLERKVGREEACRRIVAITDASKGALRTLADQEGYKTFVIPDNVGGRFSVLTPVGLLPIAVAGFNIRELVAGAVEMRALCMEGARNRAVEYAMSRIALYRKGYVVELLANFHPKLHYMTEWWKQLYGESEGKEHKGIFPAGVDFTTDLHSMGQYIQDGRRMLMETVITVENADYKVVIPHDDANLDKLNFLAGKRVDEVNKMAELGTRLAHVDGGVPNMQVIIPVLNAFYIGELIYFFEFACGVSGNLLQVNPFDQPGVEAYKNNMFALLDKPGYEEASRAIREKLGQK